MQRSRPQRFPGNLDLEVTRVPYGFDHGVRARSGEVVSTQLDAGTVTQVTNAELPISKSLQGLFRTIDPSEDARMDHRAER